MYNVHLYNFYIINYKNFANYSYILQYLSFVVIGVFCALKDLKTLEIHCKHIFFKYLLMNHHKVKIISDILRKSPEMVTIFKNTVGLPLQHCDITCKMTAFSLEKNLFPVLPREAKSLAQ